MLNSLMTLVAITFVSTAAFANPQAKKFNCIIAKVVDGGAFENINDFSFADYPYVAYDGNSESIEGKSLLVGALKFTEQDEDQPSVITEDFEDRRSIIIVEPEDSGQIFSIQVDDQKRGMLYYSDETRSAAEVAELDCD